MLRKVLYSCAYNGTERHVTCEHFENAASRAKSNVHHPDIMKLHSLLCMLLMMMSVFVTTPECLFVKSQSYVLTTCELTC